MKYRIQLSGGGLEPKTKYRKTLESARKVFESAFDVSFFDLTPNRAVLMSNDGSGWLMMEEKFIKDGVVEWVEYDFNFELDFYDGQFLEVSQASSSAGSALDEVHMQYQDDDDLSSIKYVGWTS
jgi:hypothetical protein